MHAKEFRVKNSQFIFINLKWCPDHSSLQVRDRLSINFTPYIQLGEGILDFLLFEEILRSNSLNPQFHLSKLSETLSKSLIPHLLFSISKKTLRKAQGTPIVGDQNWEFFTLNSADFL